MTTAMHYHLAKFAGKPFAIIPTITTRLSGKVRLPSCRVAGVLNMACPYTNECSDDLLSAMADYLKDFHKGKKLSFADMPQVTPFAQVMGKICSNKQERTSFHVPLSRFSSHDEYVASLPKNIYKNIRKAYNHLKTDGKTMELRRFDHSNMPDNAYMQSLWKLYFMRKTIWRHKKSSVLTKWMNGVKSIAETYSGCASRSLKALRAAELYVMEIDSKPAAFMIVYRHRSHLLMPKLAIDTDFGRYSPGILLILEASRIWISEGIADFDMCRGDERYKKEMGGINEPLCRIDCKL